MLTVLTLMFFALVGTTVYVVVSKKPANVGTHICSYLIATLIAGVLGYFIALGVGAAAQPYHERVQQFALAGPDSVANAAPGTYFLNAHSIYVKDRNNNSLTPWSPPRNTRVRIIENAQPDELAVLVIRSQHREFSWNSWYAAPSSDIRYVFEVHLSPESFNQFELPIN